MTPMKVVNLIKDALLEDIERKGSWGAALNFAS